MKLILILGLAISLGLAQESVADSYYWNGGSSGNFSSPIWFDTTTPGSGTGPPGAGDSADAVSADLTLDSGSVMELQGEGATFDVEGQFSAGSLQGNETIVGGGLLTGTTVDASLDIEGGNVSASSFASPETYVDSGGSLTVNGSFTDHRYLECSGVGSMITAQAGMTDVGLMLGPGGQVTTAGIVNLLGSSCVFQGSGALVSDSGDLDLGEGATLNVLSNATLHVSGDANLDGGANISDGGATWSDPQTSVQVEGVLNVGYKYGSFYLDILNGAQVESGSSYIGAAGGKGYVTVSGSNTLWNVQPGGLLVGSVSPGSLTINSGAGLAFASGAPFAIAYNSNSPGLLQLDGPGSYINALAVPVKIGYEAGSQGTAEIQNLAIMQVGGDFDVGDGGMGTLTLSSAQLNLTGAANRFGLGHQAGAYGSVELSDGATLTNQGYTTVGDAGGGYLSAYGSTIGTSGTTVGNTNGSIGTASISGSNSYWLETNEFIVASLPNSTGTTYVTSQAVLRVPGNCQVGNGGKGNFYIQSGGSCFVPDGPDNKFGVGNSSGSTGLMLVSDPNSLLSVGAPSIIGVSGNGTVVVTNGASVVSDIVELAAFPGSTGSINVTGSNSTWFAANNLFIGGVYKGPPGGAGNVLVQDSGTLRAGPLFFISPSGTVTLDSTGQIGVGRGAFGGPGTLGVTSGGKLLGSGTVQGEVVIASGKFVPGGSPGNFSINGSLEQQAGGEMDIFIGGVTPGSGFCQVNITGAATLGGTLNVVFTNGFIPPAGQTVTILNAAGVNGTFAHVNGASVSYGATSVTLSNLTGTTGTPRLTIQPQTQGQNVVLTWPETVQGYTLQTSSTLAPNSWANVTADENTYVAPSGTTQAFFRLVR